MGKALQQNTVTLYLLCAFFLNKLVLLFIEVRCYFITNSQ